MLQLDKKITSSKKYSHVKSSLNTGKTMKDVEIVSKSKIIINMTLGDKLVAKRANEKFFRIKCSTLAKLINGFNFSESVYNWPGMEESKEEQKSVMSKMETESVYSMLTDNTVASSITVSTN